MRGVLHDALRGHASADEMSQLSSHLESCADCRQLEASERALSDLLTQRPQYRAPPDLVRRLGDLGLPALERERRPWNAPFTALAAVLLAMVGITAGTTWQRSTSLARMSVQRLTEEAVNDHLRVLEGERPLSVQSGGIHQVRPWFAGRLDFAPRVEFTGNDEFPLEGGAITRFLDRRAAIFVYKRRLHTASLFVVRAEGLSWPKGVRQHIERGYNLILWQKEGQGYALVSDLDAKELRRLAEALGANP